MDDLQKRNHARSEREHQTAQLILRQAGITKPDEALVKRIASSLNHFAVNESNIRGSEREKELTAQLQELGVQVDMKHFTGDSSYPTEYRLEYERACGYGPTFDMALMDWIQEVRNFSMRKR